MRIGKNQMAQIAAEKLGCGTDDLRSWPAEGLQEGCFFATGEHFGAARVLVGPDGGRLMRPSAVSEAKHVRQYLDGERN